MGRNKQTPSVKGKFGGVARGPGKNTKAKKNEKWRGGGHFLIQKNPPDREKRPGKKGWQVSALE